MIIIFDTETTGLLPHPYAPLSVFPRIIEFGAVLLDPANGEIVEEVSLLFNPGVKLEPVITKLTGLTDADLEDAHTFEQSLPQLVRLFRETSCVVAHNLPFDRGMIRSELKRLGVIDFPWPKKEVCTVGIYRDAWGRNPKLTELYEFTMGRPLAQAHRALDDVKAMVEIIQEENLWELMRKDEDDD